MNPEVIIELALPENVPAALAVMMDSVLGHYFDKPLATQILTEAQSKSELIVATENAEVVGFYVNASHGSFLVFPYLHLLAVKTSKRGKSVGTKLLEHLEASTLAAPGYPIRPKVFLLVAKDNEGAVRFYGRHGYMRKAVFDDMFADGDTEFLMMKDLGKKAARQK